MKRLHDTMFTALQPVIIEEKNVVREIGLMTEMHKKEIESLKAQHNDFMKFLERQIKELKDQLDPKDAALKDWETKYKALKEDHKNEIISIRDLRSKEMETIQELHMKELEELKKQHEEEMEKLFLSQTKGELEESGVVIHKNETRNTPQKMVDLPFAKSVPSQSQLQRSCTAISKKQSKPEFIEELDWNECEEGTCDVLQSSGNTFTGAMNIECTVDAIEKVGRSELKQLKE